MSFDDNLPRQLAEARIKYTDLRWKKQDMYHDCGCEYCEYDGLKEDYTEEDVEIIEREMKGMEEDFARIKRYAADRNIDVSNEKIRAWEKLIRDKRRQQPVASL